ncbi:MAG: tyrosine decarboxylase MfnA [Candidatus Thermoplasmatota archaeon]|nr:tyrosine decarboxylase MfnA [Candidatus Thermoplasmatota archaeon]
MDRKGRSLKNILAELSKAYQEDYHFSEGRILGSMCTEPHQLALKAHRQFIESNLGNPDLYQGTKRLHKEVIKMLSKLLHGKGICGNVLSGGTEANITALWIAKKLTGNKKVIMPKSAHFSFIKACDLMNLEPVFVGLDESYRMDIEEAKRKLSNGDVCAVVGVAGSTELGVVDPIPELSELCNENAFLHVDAAFGGFVIPFLKELGYKLPDFDFSLPGVCSITMDPHKMGFSTIPCGCLLVREKKYFEIISRKADYLTGKHTCLLGTRCSASVASAYAVMKFFGRSGYRQAVKKCMATTHYLCDRIVEIGLKLVAEPTMNIVGIKISKVEKVIKDLAKRKWYVSKACNPKCLRIVVMPHVTKKVVDKFIPELEKVCKIVK